MLRIYSEVLLMVREVREVLRVIERKDVDLARQLRRAVASVPLNVAEGMYSMGGNRRARYCSAMGSAREVLACVEVAEGFVGPPPFSA